jgi:hypothetical protein
MDNLSLPGLRFLCLEDNTMHIEHKSQTVTYEVTADIDYIDLGDNLAVYRLSREWRTSDGNIPALFKELPASQATEGFARLSALQSYIKGKGKLPREPEKLCLVQKDYLQLAARYGFMDAWERLGKNVVLSIDKPFTAISEGTASAEQLVQVDTASHLLFDRNGEILPVAQYFDYINAGMCDGRYDLEKALEILKKNPRIHGVTNRGKEEELQIIPVEYYNRERYCSQYLRFWFEPTLEEQRQLWAKQCSYGREYPSTDFYRAVFDLDILGLRAGGAAYYDDHYMTRQSDDAFRTESGDDY